MHIFLALLALAVLVLLAVIVFQIAEVYALLRRIVALLERLVDGARQPKATTLGWSPPTTIEKGSGFPPPR